MKYMVCSWIICFGIIGIVAYFNPKASDFNDVSVIAIFIAGIALGIGMFADKRKEKKVFV